jgi:two-component system OmpR family sensor kinase
MQSLRARLVAGLLVVAAAGLLVAAGVTYVEQRSFQLTRIDQQARTAIPAVSRALSEQAGESPGFGSSRGGRSPDGGPGMSLPPGTYGQRRASDGRADSGEKPTVFGYADTVPPAPRLPAKLAAGEYRTVEAVTGGTRYRVYAAPDFQGGGMTVVAVTLSEVDQTLHRLLLVQGLVIAGVLLALAVGALFLVRLGLRPLDRIAATADAIAGGDLSRRVSPATPRTEVGRLGMALNAMLGRLERAFTARQASEDRLRRFLADASHELRTPLASIRGYAELFRIGAAREPEDTEKAMTRIEQEAARMGVLVEDLLTLARLDELREPVRDAVDLAQLARDAVDDARAIAPDRIIDVTAEGATTLAADGHQLRQVLGNLLRNALVHTPSGTPIEVRVAGEGPDVTLEVRDHGLGLPTDDAGRLFERFWRAEGGRERGKGGAGLGLAIVAGIVSAHQGHVDAGNAPGGGARFTVHLPVRAAQPDRVPAA